MNNKTIEQLKRLRAVQPDPGFVRHSRNLILSSAPLILSRPWYATSLFRFAGAAVAIVMGLLGASTVLFPLKPVLSSSLNPDSLQNEIRNTIAIQVEEITYDQATNQTITSAINEISDTNTKHLNTATLKGEIDTMNLNDDTTSTVDDLLNQVLQ